MIIEPTSYIRKLDSVGRVIVPSKLRDKYNIVDGADLQYIHIVDEDSGKHYIGFEVESPNAKDEKLNKLLKEYGLNNVEELLNALSDLV